MRDWEKQKEGRKKQKQNNLSAPTTIPHCHLHITPLSPPLAHPTLSPAHSPLGKKQDEMTLCIWKCPERCLIYVCIRCKFYYGTQGGLWDFPLNTWLPWSNPISLIQTRGRKIEGVKEEELEEIYNLDIDFSKKKKKKKREVLVVEGPNYIASEAEADCCRRGFSDQEPGQSTAGG